MMKYFFLFLSLFAVVSCKKNKIENSKNENKTFTKINNDTIFIKEKCAVFISCTLEQIEREKKEYGEENFYIAADDYNYYEYEAHQFLEKQKLKIYNIVDKKVIVFKSKKGNFIVLRDTIKGIGSTYLFSPNKLPKKVFDIDIDLQYKEYFDKEKF